MTLFLRLTSWIILLSFIHTNFSLRMGDNVQWLNPPLGSSSRVIRSAPTDFYRLGDDLYLFTQSQLLRQELEEQIERLDLTDLVEDLKELHQHGKGIDFTSVQRGFEQTYHKGQSFPNEDAALRALLVTFLHGALFYNRPLYGKDMQGRLVQVGPYLAGALIHFIKEQKLLIEELEEKLWVVQHSFELEKEISRRLARIDRNVKNARRRKAKEEEKYWLQMAFLWVPRNAYLINSLGHFYYKQHEWGKAMILFRCTVDLPRYPTLVETRHKAFALTLIGKIYTAQGRRDRAFHAFNTALALKGLSAYDKASALEARAKVLPEPLELSLLLRAI